MWGTEKLNAPIPEKRFDLLKFDDYLIPLIAFHWTMDCWKILLFARQLSTIRRAIIVPPQFIGRMDLDVYRAKRKIAISGHISAIFLMAFMLIVKTLKLALGYHAFLWGLTAHYGDSVEHRAAWYAAFGEVFDGLTLLPVYLSSYLLFRRKSGSVVAVFLSVVVQIFFSAISAAQSIMFLIWVTDSFGANALFHTPLALNLVGLVFMAVYIHSVVPEKLEKLLTSTSDGELKGLLMTLTSTACYPVDRIYIDRGIPGPNAYFMGIFGAKMIAVSPELMTIMDGREVAACVTHELGHWSHHHNSVLLMFALASVLCTSSGWLYAYDNPLITQTFRFKETPQAVIPVILWITYVSTLSLDLIAGVNSLVGCKCEYSADAFAVPRGLGSALADGLMALTANSRRFPFYDTWFSAWFNHHPTVFQRIGRLNKIDCQ